MLRLEGKEQRQVDTALESLSQEFRGQLPAQTVQQVANDVLKNLLGEARFPDFVPVLARRYTRERLLLDATAPT
jgi:hypothetical protein